jgi:4-hydroxy-4-methyl-2-oxoglutarate aldolase
LVATSSLLTSAVFKSLLKFDTCTVSNAIERLNGRLRNEGSISGRVTHCVFPELPTILGYAATGRMRSTSPPVSGRAYHENTHWWRYVASIPEPRVMVVEDADEQLGAGALMGELHALIGIALDCIGYVTNGAVRDLPAVRALGFQMFAGSVAVSHMYSHIAEYGHPVEIGGLKVSPGDLIQGDCHGVHVIPLLIAPEIPGMASQILKEEHQLRELCQSPHFSLSRLEKQLQKLPGDGFEMPLGEH